MRSSPYLHPEWLALRRTFVRRMVRGTGRLLCWHCDARPGCQVHHTAYLSGRGWRRLLVPLQALQWVCAECHEAIEQHKAAARAQGRRTRAVPREPDTTHPFTEDL